jgi:hypothetical protein
MADDELINLERDGWTALATSRDKAVAYYDTVLDAHPIMIFPHNVRLEDRDAIMASIDPRPWRTYEIDDLRVLSLTASAAIVTYGVTAEREGESHSALVSSTYVRRTSGWRLAARQHTPR